MCGYRYFDGEECRGEVLERLEPVEIEGPRPSSDKLVVYDFRGERTASEFFQNLERLLIKIRGFRV